MALKDWKKDKKSDKDVILFRNKKDWILIYKYGNRWKVERPYMENHIFLNKQQALKFAKAYMRKH